MTVKGVPHLHRQAQHHLFSVPEVAAGREKGQLLLGTRIDTAQGTKGQCLPASPLAVVGLRKKLARWRSDDVDPGPADADDIRRPSYILDVLVGQNGPTNAPEVHSNGFDPRLMASDCSGAQVSTGVAPSKSHNNAG